MRLILLAVDKMQKIPSEVEVINMRRPRKFESVRLMIKRIDKMIIDNLV
tara:strand:- start:492 stop:638 length:147 start_codon:yes stop_codon:yes gene_type:complete